MRLWYGIPVSIDIDLKYVTVAKSRRMFPPARIDSSELLLVLTCCLT